METLLAGEWQLPPTAAEWHFIPTSNPPGIVSLCGRIVDPVAMRYLKGSPPQPCVACRRFLEEENSLEGQFYRRACPNSLYSEASPDAKLVARYALSWRRLHEKGLRRLRERVERLFKGEGSG